MLLAAVTATDFNCYSCEFGNCETPTGSVNCSDQAGHHCYTIQAGIQKCKCKTFWSSPWIILFSGPYSFSALTSETTYRERQKKARKRTGEAVKQTQHTPISRLVVFNWQLMEAFATKDALLRNATITRTRVLISYNTRRPQIVELWQGLEKFCSSCLRRSPRCPLLHVCLDRKNVKRSREWLERIRLQASFDDSSNFRLHTELYFNWKFDTINS